MRRAINWPNNKLLACTFTIALEAFRKSGRFKRDPKIPVNLCSISHANYGGNAGIWRLMEVLERNHVRAMILANGLAVQKWPDAVRALHKAGHEIAGHGMTNDIDMTDLTPAQQLEEIRTSTKIIQDTIGARPVGWFGPGGLHTEETLGLLAEEGYLWSADLCDDDVPYVVQVNGKRICIIPKSWYANDWRAWGEGASNGATFFTGYKEGFDFVYEEARRGRPGMIDGLVHAELGGRPYMAVGFENMIKLVNRHRSEIWQPTYREIAEHCLATIKDAEEYKPYG